MTTNYDFIIVGAGVVGLAVACELKKRHPSSSIAILEKEKTLGVHASGRNSGVLHCGIYYGSDTLKAKVCAQGASRMIAFAKQHNIACEQSGKVILATNESQRPTLNRLMQNAKANGINARLITSSELQAFEPAAAPGIGAIHCPDTAVIDSPAVLKQLHNTLTQQGVAFYFDCHVIKDAAAKQIKTKQGLFSYGFLFNCAGAYADILAKQFGLAEHYTLVPFKGMYWKLHPDVNAKVRANIYPVPDVSLPFLGVHLTRVISGDVYVGPTAIPVLGRENYHRLQGTQFKEAVSIGYRLAAMVWSNQNNFRKLAATEMAKYCKKSFLNAAKKLVPSLKIEDLVPTAKSGIRPQLINVKTKQLEMDYIFEREDASVHVLNAISPAFTSSFAFAELIVDQME